MQVEMDLRDEVERGLCHRLECSVIDYKLETMDLLIKSVFESLKRKTQNYFANRCNPID